MIALLFFFLTWLTGLEYDFFNELAALQWRSFGSVLYVIYIQIHILVWIIIVWNYSAHQSPPPALWTCTPSINEVPNLEISLRIAR